MTPEIAAGDLMLGWERTKPVKRLGFAAATVTATVDEQRLAYAKERDSHHLTIGPTGSGKGVGCLMPTLLTYPGSVIVVDVKGEAVEVTAQRRAQMGQTVVVIDPFAVTSWKKTGAFNPLDIHDLVGGPVEDIAMEMPQLLRSGGGTSGPARDQTSGDFWEVRADGLVAGLLAYLLEPALTHPSGRTLIALRDLLMADDVVYNLAVVLDTQGKQLPALAHKQIASFLGTVEVTRSGILATATERVSALFHPGVERALSATSFSLGALRDGKPISIFLVIPPGKLQSHGRVLRVWLSALLAIMQTRRTLPEFPTLFLADEVGQLGALDPLRTALTLLRGFGMRTWTFWQDVSQLRRLYGDWETLTNNCSIQILGANTLAAAKAAADLTGPAYSPEDVLNLSEDEGILIEKGRARTVGKLNYLTDELFHGLAAPHPMFAGRKIRKVTTEPEKKAVRAQPRKMAPAHHVSAETGAPAL